MKDTMFHIEENYDVSFTNFFESLFLMPFASKTVKLYKEYYGIRIPKELIERTETVFMKSWQFLLKRKIRKEEIETWKIKNLKQLIKTNRKRFFEELDGTINIIEKIHLKNWNKFSSNRKEFIIIVKDIIKRYGDDIVKEIEKITKIPWKETKIKIFPTLDIKHREIGNALLLAFIKKTEKDIVMPLVHETTHVNTHSIWKKHRKEGNLLNANEIATYIITLLVIENINKKFDKDFSFQQKAKKLKTLFGKDVLEQSQKIWDSTEKMKNICKKSKNYEDFLFKIHDFLKKINYEAFYEGVSGKNYSKLFDSLY